MPWIAAGTKHWSQVIVLPLQKVSQKLVKANLRPKSFSLVLRLAFTRVWGTFCIGKTKTCDLWPVTYVLYLHLSSRKSFMFHLFVLIACWKVMKCEREFPEMKLSGAPKKLTPFSSALWPWRVRFCSFETNSLNLCPTSFVATGPDGKNASVQSSTTII